MKKVIGIILTFILSVSLVSYAFAQGLILSGSGDVAVDNVVEFGFITSDWAREEVKAAYEENLIPEKLKEADFTQNINRAEFATIAVMLYENLTGEETLTEQITSLFEDVDGNSYYDYILKANYLGITNGTSENTFSPESEITREQMATMILRTLSAAEIKTEAISEINFADSNEISDYAKEAVCFMSENGIINGVGENKFAPKATATREQAILIANRSVVTFRKQSLGNTLKSEFEQVASVGSAYEIVEALVTSPSVSALSLAVIEVEEGYLTGFDNAEIKGFSEGVMFSPMIGTIPFVGYVFSLENEADADAFIKKLEDSANLRWNICTRAEEMVTGKSGNKVFFVMCPAELEE